MFHIVMSGPSAGARVLVDALTVIGFPAAIDAHRGGFDAEPDTEWVEAVASSADFLELALEQGRRFGFVLRLHAIVEEPTTQLLLPPGVTL